GLLPVLDEVVDVVGGDGGREVDEHRGVEALADGVEGGGADAVVGRDPDDVDLGHVPRAQEVGQGDVVGGVVPALEAGVGGVVLALVEHAVEVPEGEVQVELGPGSAGDAVGWPGVDVVRLGAEVAAGVDVVVAGGDDDVVAVAGGQQV